MDISVIICTYNPDHRIFQRCLTAVQKLKREGLETEVLLVDNNSPTPVNTNDYVQLFLQQCPNARLVIEKEQGLTWARKCGVENSFGKYIVFFDDDNEPDCNYLVAGVSLFAQYKDVAIWGPGYVDVDFIDGTPQWIQENFLSMYQFKRTDAIELGNSISQPKAIVNGTGMFIRKSHIINYFEEMKGSFLNDRKGRSLASGGDTQIVFYTFKKQLCTGTSPSLCINHIIPSKRVGALYLARLHFGIYYSLQHVYHSVYPELTKPLHQTVLVLSIGKMILRGHFSLLIPYVGTYYGLKIGNREVTGRHNGYLLSRVQKLFQ